MKKLVHQASWLYNQFKGTGKSAAIVVIGTAAAQFITLLASPILSRLYSPAEFGTLGFFLAVAIPLSVVANGRYDQPIVLADTDMQAWALSFICLAFASAIAIMVAVLFPLLSALLANHFNIQLRSELVLLPMWVVGTGVLMMAQQLVYRQKQYSMIALLAVTRATFIISIQVFYVIFMFKGSDSKQVSGLIWGMVFGQIVAAACLLAIASSNTKSGLFKAFPNRLVIADQLWQYRRFFLYGTPQELINSLSQQLPFFILTAAFSQTVVGLFWMAFRVMSLPAQLIGTSIRSVLLSSIGEDIRLGKNIDGTLFFWTIVLVAIGSFMFLPVVAFGPSMFQTLLGPEWLKAGDFAKWMAVWSWAALANIPSVCCVQAFGLQRRLLSYEVVLFIARLGCLLFGATHLSAISTIALFSITSTIFNLALIVYVFNEIFNRKVLPR